MTDFAPPAGPPPPKVPEGWKAVWNDQYHEWFFVNIYTKVSQWDKPEHPVYPPGEAPDGAPPSYAPPGASGAAAGPPSTVSDTKSGYGSNNPYAQQQNMSEDEKLARKLQEEEQARSQRHSGDANRAAANDYYNASGSSGGYGQQSYGQQSYGQQSYGQPQQQQSYQEPAQDRGKGKSGLLGKLLGKASGGSSSRPPQQYGGHSGYGGQPGYGAAPMGYGGQPMMYQQPGYGMPMGGGMGGGRRPGGGGMGMMGGAALGAGGGLLGGMLLGEALGDAGDHGGDGGGDYGGDGGGDYGGDGGGDFDGGGGDFGGD